MAIFQGDHDEDFVDDNNSTLSQIKSHGLHFALSYLTSGFKQFWPPLNYAYLFFFSFCFFWFFCFFVFVSVKEEHRYKVFSFIPRLDFRLYFN